MIWALYGICFASMILLAIVAIPSDLRILILENCKNSKGRYRLRYIAKELVSVSHFYGEMLYYSGILAIILSFGLIVIDSFFKIEIIQSVAEQADWDLNRWEKNLRSSPKNVERQFTHFHISQGGNENSAREIMIFLWRGLPLIFLFCFATLLLIASLSANVFNHSLHSLVQVETKRNRRRIRERYLRSTSS